MQIVLRVFNYITAIKKLLTNTFFKNVQNTQTFWHV